MALFIYDGNPGHDWEAMVGEHALLVELGDGLAGGAPVVDDVLLCHRIAIPAIESQIQSWASAGVVVIEVSSNKGTREPPRDTYYRRAKEVGANNAHFAACFRNFVRNLKQGTPPPWHLLEGPPAPDALFAYHLLSILPDDDVAARKKRDELCTAAWDEVAAIRAAYVPKECTNATLPEFDKIDNAEQRREFLKACR